MTILGIRITKTGAFITAVAVALLMAFPVTRRIIWWLLPAGSGNDDIIQGAALAVIVILIFVEIWTKRYPNNPYNHRRK
jgi:hypothetical protein